MSPIAAPPPPPSVDQPRRKRRGFAINEWLSEKPETRSIQIGVLATILVHLLLLLIVPYWFKPEPFTSRGRQHTHTFNINLAPLPKRPPPQHKVLPKFVETNPNAPENIPDHTNNVSNRNQQSAQEKPSKINNTDMPAQEGKKDFKNDQIVDGRLSKPQPPTPPEQQPTKPQPKTQAIAHAQQNPLPGFEKNQNNNPDAFGTNISKPSANDKPIPHKIAGDTDGPLLDIPTFAPPTIDAAHPRQRPTLDVHSRPAIIAENVNGTHNVGVTGRDARWSNYGAYLERLEEAVQAEWDNIMEHAPYPPPGSTVTITFILNSSGEISKIIHVESSASCTEIGTKACNSALTDPQPYGKWTDDMISVFGTEQELTFSFYYE